MWHIIPPSRPSNTIHFSPAKIRMKRIIKACEINWARCGHAPIKSAALMKAQKLRFTGAVQHGACGNGWPWRGNAARWLRNFQRTFIITAEQQCRTPAQITWLITTFIAILLRRNCRLRRRSEAVNLHLLQWVFKVNNCRNWMVAVVMMIIHDKKKNNNREAL